MPFGCLFQGLSGFKAGLRLMGMKNTVELNTGLLDALRNMLSLSELLDYSSPASMICIHPSGPHRTYLLCFKDRYNLKASDAYLIQVSLL